MDDLGGFAIIFGNTKIFCFLQQRPPENDGCFCWIPPWTDETRPSHGLLCRFRLQPTFSSCWPCAETWSFHQWIVFQTNLSQDYLPLLGISFVCVVGSLVSSNTWYNPIGYTHVALPTQNHDVSFSTRRWMMIFFSQKKGKKQSSAASVPTLSTLEFRLGWFLSTPGATSTQTLSATKGAPGGGEKATSKCWNWDFVRRNKPLLDVKVYRPGSSLWPFYPLVGGHLAFERVT